MLQSDAFKRLRLLIKVFRDWRAWPPRSYWGKLWQEAGVTNFQKHQMKPSSSNIMCSVILFVSLFCGCVVCVYVCVGVCIYIYMEACTRLTGIQQTSATVLSPLPTVLGSQVHTAMPRVQNRCWGFEFRSLSLQSKHFYPMKHPSSPKLPNLMPLTNIVKQRCDNMQVGCFPAETLGPIPSSRLGPCSQKGPAPTDDTLLGTQETIKK